MQIGVFTFGELHPDPLTGTTVSPRQRLRDIVEQAEVADQAGLSVFGIGEHHRADYAISSPVTVLATIAGRTRSIRLTSAVSVLSSADPVALFEEFAMLDLLSDGRAEVLVGRGAFSESFSLYGLRLEDYDALFEEKIEMLLQLREHETVTWIGRFRSPLHEQGIYPRPLQTPLPVWIGIGGTPASAARAGRLGLPLTIGIIGGQPRHFAPLAELYRQQLRAAGHDPAKLAVAITAHTFVAPTSQQAASSFYPPYAAYMATLRGRATPMSTIAFDHATKKEGHLLVGSPAQVTEKILYQHELFGHQRLLAQISLGSVPHKEALQAIELLGEHVLPAVNGALGPEPAAHGCAPPRPA